jgi:hypothetical protein
MSEVAPPDLPSSPDYVGREAELTSLAAALEQARDGRGSLYLVGGEPGIGKSRLADEFAQHARSRDARVLWGRAWEEAGAPAYWPWIQVLRAHMRATDATTACRQLGAGAADVAQILPEIANLVPDLPPPPPASDSARFQLFDSTTTFLRNLAADQPAVIVLDDLHAADTPSILLLRFVASQLADIRAVLVATYRDVELTPDHPLTHALTDLTREPTSRLLALKGLAEEAIGPLIRASEGIAASPRLVRGLWAKTGGNPLFIREAIRLLSSEGGLREEALARRRLALPASVREAIRGRLRQFGEATLHVLTCGAVSGPEFSSELVRRVGDYSGHEHLVLLGEAVRAGLLMQPAAGRFRFAHDLIREALYGELEPVERVRLHRRVAETLEELNAGSDAVNLAELAHHYFEAAQDSLEDADELAKVADKARGYARRAGEQASRALAYEEAARLYAMGLELVGSAHDNLRERADLLIARGDAQARAGDLASARPSFLEAARLARRSGSAEQLARAALGYGGRFLWARAGDDLRLVPLLQDALVMLAGSNDRLRVRLLSRLASAWRGSNEHLEQADALSEQAVELARRLGDPATLCYALVGRYGATYWPDNADQRLETARELLVVSEEAGDTERMIDALMVLSFTYADLCRMSEARGELDKLTRLARELRQPAQLWIANAVRTSYALLAGEFDRARQLIEIESPAGYPTTPIRDDISAMRMHRFLLAREQGTTAQAEADVRRSAEEFGWYPAHRAALIHVLLDNDRGEGEARAIFSELAANDFAAFSRDNEWIFGISLISEACFRLAEKSAAPTLYGQLAPYAGLHAVAHAEGSAGVVDRYLGLLAMTVGHLAEAERHLDDAVRINEQMGAWPWAAHTRADLAELLRRRGQVGDLERAADEYRSAHAVAERLGMARLLARLQAATPPTGEARELATQSDLTATFHREGDYWTIAYGDDNFRLHDAKGLRYLALLLAQPGREVLALDLARGEQAPSSTKIEGAELRVTAVSDAGALLDDQATQAYRARLHELQAELDEAESWNDAERAERARSEMEFLARELARAVGLGGRQRTAGSASERARVAVTRAVRSAMSRIAEHSALLGDHLEATIHTGTYCAYRPDPRAPFRWQT